MRLKYAFFLSFFCVIILSCTDKKPVSQAQESSVQQEDSVPVKKVDSVKAQVQHRTAIPSAGVA